MPAQRSSQHRQQQPRRRRAARFLRCVITVHHHRKLYIDSRCSCAVGEGGVVHEHRHALTWVLSPGTLWEDTDLST